MLFNYNNLARKGFYRHLYYDILHTYGSLYKINVITHTTQYSHGYYYLFKHSPVEKSIIHYIHTRLAPPPQRCRTVPNTSDNARIPCAIGQRASPPLSISQSSEALTVQPSSQYILPDSCACGTGVQTDTAVLQKQTQS